MIHVMVSACLVGQPIRYDGRTAPFRHTILDRWLQEKRVVAFCPETAGMKNKSSRRRHFLRKHNSDLRG